MLILGVNFAPERSGIAPYTTGIARGLQGYGHSVRVVTSFPHYPEWRHHWDGPPRTLHEIHEGLPVTRLRHYVPTRPSNVRRLAFEVSFGLRLALAEWGDPDVVIAVSPALISSAAAVGRARLRPRRPAVGLIVQDLYSRGVQETGLGGRRFGSLAGAVERQVTEAVDGVAVIHERFRDQVTQNFGVADERVRVIRNWTHVKTVPDAMLSEFRRQMGWRPDEIVVLHSGAMGAKQGLENVIEAARIADARAEPIRFVLVGDGSQRMSLERAAAGVESVEFLDHLDDAAFGRALRAADVLLVNERPGVREMAVPSKLTSYFSSGRPVLAASDARSTTADELQASGGGLRVEPGDPLALITGVIQLGRDKRVAAELGENGRRYSADTLSEATAIREYDKWVRDLASTRR